MFSFGHDIDYTFFPLIDDQPVSVSSDAPSIWVFTDTNGRPTRAEALAGTGALGSEITSWTKNGNGYTFTIPAISDPEPDSETGERTYYIAVNFTFESGGQEQTVIRALELRRVQGHHKSLIITQKDLKSVWPSVTAYASDNTKLTNFINLAIQDIKAELRDKGYQWARLYRPDRLHVAGIHKVLMYVARSQIRETDDNFNTLYNMFREDYNSMLKSLKIEYDNDDDGVPDENADIKGFSINIA